MNAIPTQEAVRHELTLLACVDPYWKGEAHLWYSSDMCDAIGATFGEEFLANGRSVFPRMCADFPAGTWRVLPERMSFGSMYIVGFPPDEIEEIVTSLTRSAEIVKTFAKSLRYDIKAIDYLLLAEKVRGAKTTSEMRS